MDEFRSGVREEEEEVTNPLDKLEQTDSLFQFLGVRKPDTTWMGCIYLEQHAVGACYNLRKHLRKQKSVPR